MELKEIVQVQKQRLFDEIDNAVIRKAEYIYKTDQCTVLSQSGKGFSFMNELGESCELLVNDEVIVPGTREWNEFSLACFLKLEEELNSLDFNLNEEHNKYTREGMKARVLEERRSKSANAKYKIKWADNIYGDHIVTNEKGVKYKVFLRDFENETGYSDSEDAKNNKLGTTKHIMFAFNALKADKGMYLNMSKEFPFIEIYLDPLNDYNITWFFEGELEVEDEFFLSLYFDNNRKLKSEKISNLLKLIGECDKKDNFLIRPEVREKMEEMFDANMLNALQVSHDLEFSSLKVKPFEYQKEGIRFATFRKNAIIADEMGLGKTLQAIGTAIQKKEIFDFKKTLIVCPASLKEQWESEIEKFTSEKAIVISGAPEERARQYLLNEPYFFITNYESVLRDQMAINRAEFDLIILDEAQRTKNYETKTASSLKRLDKNHVLVITGTPLENKLIDLYSIVSLFDPHFLGPLWEFSYQHCLFDPEKPNKITGYYNLSGLKTKLKSILIRREKKDVFDQLKNVNQSDVKVGMTSLQEEYHSSYAMGISKILHKKFLTPFDLQRLQLLLTNMRMVCNSTFLIDKETNQSPKLEELHSILFDNLDIANNDHKLIIFSEWITMHKLIGEMLRKNNVGFVELNGKVPVKLRGELIRKFESDNNCKVFLSTEAGGSGLNLQVADNLINFELPWNPAKKNQRIGRIDRLGQKSDNLQVFNLITHNSIEEKIAEGLLLKHSLFEGALSGSTDTDFVDFSKKGRPQFIEELKGIIDDFESPDKSIETVADQVEQEEEEELMNVYSEQTSVSSHSENQPEEGENKVAETEKVGSALNADIEQTMNSGMQFLAGLFKMATGQSIELKDQSIEVDKETGEVTMKFKLPGM